jgi:hypothetical protein
MTCDHCCVRGIADGRSLVVCVWYERLEELGPNDASAFLYRCPACGTYFIASAWFPHDSELTPGEAKRLFPGILGRD